MCVISVRAVLPCVRACMRVSTNAPVNFQFPTELPFLLRSNHHKPEQEKRNVLFNVLQKMPFYLADH